MPAVRQGENQHAYYKTGLLRSYNLALRLHWAKRALSAQSKAQTQLELAAALLKIKSLIIYDNATVKEILSSPLSENDAVKLYFQLILSQLSENPELALGQAARIAAQNSLLEGYGEAFAEAAEALKEIECADVEHAAAAYPLHMRILKKTEKPL